ncbi:MAG: hypothetical protein EOP22_18140 [Hyphomicrobiales bacterium]|nr:MAG: hypothetical protein EOP22_18140 [Hyphomicrobiales bacterium]
MRIKLAALAAIVTTSCVTPVLAMDWTGWYAGIYGGVSVRNDAAMNGALVAGQFGEDGAIWPPTAVNNVGNIDPLAFDILTQVLQAVDSVPDAEAIAFVANGTLGFAPGPTLGAVTGYSFGNGVRVESDWSVSQFQPSRLTITESSRQDIIGGFSGTEWNWTQPGSPTEFGGFPPVDLGDMTISTSATFVLGNAWYDFANETDFTPYLGAGLGLANVQTMAVMSGGASGSSSAWVPAGQLGGGLLVDLNETSFLDLGYRFKAAASNNSTAMAGEYVGGGAFVGLALGQGGPVTVHTLQAGINVRLN